MKRIFSNAEERRVFVLRRRGTGIWLRGVCASVTVVEKRIRTKERGFEQRTFGRDCRFGGEAAG